MGDDTAPRRRLVGILARLAEHELHDPKAVHSAIKVLFRLIEEHHGLDATQKFFEAATLPKKMARKRVLDDRLRDVVADLLQRWPDADVEKVAKVLMGDSAEPIRKLLGLHRTTPTSLEKRYRRTRPASKPSDKNKKNVP